MTLPIPVTIITAEHPPRLTKHYSMEGEKLVKETGAALERGQLDTIELGSLSAFPDILTNLKTNQALVYGIPAVPGAKRIVTRRMLGMTADPSAIARTNEHFAWNTGPGIMMLDYDPPESGTVMTQEDLVSLLREAIPALAETPICWYPSASSHITRLSDSQDLTGLRGQRLYLAVMEATDITRIGEYLSTWSWATGQGSIRISSSGQMLTRMIWDSSVWQPSRLDFAAGASCGPGLEQRRGKPVLHGSQDGTPFDSRRLLPDPPPELRERAKAALEKARYHAQPEAHETRRIWVEARKRAFPFEAMNHEHEAMVTRAVEHSFLSSDFHILACPAGGTEYRSVTIGQVVADPSKWHGGLTRDPLEPGYDGGRSVGKLFLLHDTPCLHSFARGGQTYRLERQIQSCTVHSGKTQAATNTTLETMQKSLVFFNRGSSLLGVSQGRTLTLDEPSLSYLIGNVMIYQKADRRGELQEIDPPAAVLKQVLSLRQTRRLPELLATATSPLLRPDGSLVDKRGFDVQTGVHFAFDPEEFPPVPTAPTLEQAHQALRELLGPFALFRTADHVADSALLTAILTAIERPALPTAPGLAFLSPLASDGKSLLMSAIAALGTGRVQPILPPISGVDDEETRKRIHAAIEPGEHATMLVDNVTGPQRSATLAALLTCSYWTDRPVAGAKISGAFSSRILFAMSGRNIQIEGDLPRRLIVCRLKAHKTEDFFASYPFNPVTRVLEERPKLISAALTLIRAAHCHGALEKCDSVPSYEEWNDLVRATVRWCGTTLCPGAYPDPGTAFISQMNHALDAIEDHSLLNILATTFGKEKFTSAEIAERMRSGSHNGIVDGFAGLAPGRDSLSARSVGRYLTQLRDQPSEGLALRSCVVRKTQVWWIESSLQSADGALPEPQDSLQFESRCQTSPDNTQ